MANSLKLDWRHGMSELSSPLPWHDDGYGIEDCNGKRVLIYGEETSPGNELANRKLIIVTVNSHAARVELLEAAKGVVCMVATRDIRSFVWGSDKVERLRVAIVAAEEPEP
jgi:hypothetical protein